MGGALSNGCCVSSDQSLQELGGEVAIMDKRIEERLACICIDERFAQQYASQVSSSQQAGTTPLGPHGDLGHLRIPFVHMEEDAVFAMQPGTTVKRNMPLDNVRASKSSTGQGTTPRVVNSAGSAKRSSRAVASPGKSPAVSSTNSARRTAPDISEQATRKKQLQVVVKTFVIRALGSVLCEIVDTKAAELRPGTYCLDRHLQRLLVQVDGVCGPRYDWNADIADLLQVRTGKYFNNNSELVSMLGSTDMEHRLRLLVIDHKDGRRLHLLESDARRAEDFRLAINILAMYGRDQRAQMTSRSESRRCPEPKSGADTARWVTNLEENRPVGPPVHEMRVSGGPPGGSWALSGPAVQARPPPEAPQDPHEILGLDSPMAGEEAEPIFSRESTGYVKAPAPHRITESPVAETQPMVAETQPIRPPEGITAMPLLEDIPMEGEPMESKAVQDDLAVQQEEKEALAKLGIEFKDAAKEIYQVSM
mmetsp:Transcript_101328/g.194223  ORF Transcript_101328/g.194223 Transcript_101328/m.194223 type:complete len:479 (-) Transcript_101328:102-1538(-)